MNASIDNKFLVLFHWLKNFIIKYSAIVPVNCAICPRKIACNLELNFPCHNRVCGASSEKASLHLKGCGFQPSHMCTIKASAVALKGILSWTLLPETEPDRGAGDLVAPRCVGIRERREEAIRGKTNAPLPPPDCPEPRDLLPAAQFVHHGCDCKKIGHARPVPAPRVPTMPRRLRLDLRSRRPAPDSQASRSGACSVPRNGEAPPRADAARGDPSNCKTRVSSGTSRRGLTSA